MNNVCMGIDLGTTFSCVGVHLNGRVEIVANDIGSKTTPSCVAITDRERLVGHTAKVHGGKLPESCLYNIKRIIGKKFGDENVAEDIASLPFAVEHGGKGELIIKVSHDNGTTRLAPEEVSSMVLAEMRRVASAHTGNSCVSDAVITVPAYFSNSQREATRNAGRIAGLNVLRIINEPTAAAIAYGLDKKGGRDVLVFDLGGGTLDVSLLHVEENVFDVKATAGDTHLGGEDFDMALLRHCIRSFLKKFPDLKEVEGDRRALWMWRLRLACEGAKQALSDVDSVDVKVLAMFGGEDFVFTLTRAGFEDICRDCFERCMEPVVQVLSDAGAGAGQIDDVVLVGGSTRIPKIRKMLEKMFGEEKIRKDINPDEAVAYGATVHAAVLTNKQGVGDVVVCDVVPLTLGVETVGGVMEPLVKRNTRIPVSKGKVFSTHSENQPTVTVKIFEGERRLTTHNNLLGEFKLVGIPPMPKGVPRVSVKFDVDSNGIIGVSATEESRGASKQMVISSESNRLTEEEVDRMVNDAERFRESDEISAKRITARTALESSLNSARDILSDTKDGGEETEELAHARDVVREQTSWLKGSSDNATCEEFGRGRDNVMRALEQSRGRRKRVVGIRNDT